MASAFESFETSFIPVVTDAQWDAAGKTIEEHRDKIEREVMAAGLALMSMDPRLAPFVPILSKRLGLKPSASPLTTVETIVNAYRSAATKKKDVSVSREVRFRQTVPRTKPRTRRRQQSSVPTASQTA